jgi:hypothetical protein
MPHGGIAVADYVLKTLKRNPDSLVLLEVGPDVCQEKMKDSGSRPIREIACALPPGSPQVVRMDVRNALLGPENKDFLYCANLTYMNGPMSPEDVEKYFLWKHGSLRSVAEDLVRKGDPSVLSGPIADAGECALDRQDVDVNDAFVRIKASVKAYKNMVSQGGAPSRKWWMSNIVRPLKSAWGMVLDYFLMYDIFSQTSQNEMVIVVGENHALNILPRLTASDASTRIRTGPRVKTGSNGCVELGRTGGDGQRIWGVVNVTPAVCEDIRQLSAN